MRIINIRQFLRNMKQEMGDLPLTITRYGKPLAVVVSIEEWNLLNNGPIERLKLETDYPLPKGESVGNHGVILNEETDDLATHRGIL